MIYRSEGTNSGGNSNIRKIALIFIVFVLFSPRLLAAPIPPGQNAGAQASRFMTESQKRSMAVHQQNFDKKKRAGVYIEFKDDKVGPAKLSDKDPGKNAKD